jgi:hypothetical protein
MSQKAISKKLFSQFTQEELERPEELDAENHPRLYNISSAFLYRHLPIPKTKTQPEFVYIPLPNEEDSNSEARLEVEVTISKWNMAWESGQLRSDIFRKHLPESLNVLKKYQGENVYLLPRLSFHRYDAYRPIYHLLPKHRLEYFGLPLLKRGLWPFNLRDWIIDHVLPEDFDERLSNAFSAHIWPFLNSGSRKSAFSHTEPIRVLSHNLDYWLPYLYQVVEDRLSTFDRVEFEDEKHPKEIAKIKKRLASDVDVVRPLKGGDIWVGQQDAQHVTNQLIEKADAKGNLRAIIDAIRSNRIQDDFSDHWSYAKEDFERKLYHKRSKIKVNFVELKDTIPVHGPESEAEENILWEDFLTVLSEKEKRVVVCLKQGFTRVGEIATLLGYANHSPVSKSLTRIRNKAKKFFSLN